MNNSKRLNIDILLFLFLCLLAIALFDHVVKCINFLLFNNTMMGILCFVIALAFLLVIMLCFYKFKVISLYKQRFDGLDIFFLGIFLFISLLWLPFPDTMWDTMGGELFLGKFAFTDKIFDMKPVLPYFFGIFSLAQRIFYYFRLVLGFRLSIIINFFIIFISYYKIKEILIVFFSNINEDFFKKLNKNVVAIIICSSAFAALYKEYSVLGLSLTKSDLFVIPLFLEFILLTLKPKNDDKDYAYAGLLIGLSTVMKLTNVVFFLPFILLNIIKNISSIKIKNILVVLLFCFLPMLPYIAYNVAVTGNPVFPFYNSIFKSQYFPHINPKDERWGPDSLLSIIFWPIILFLEPQKTTELGYNSNSLLIGYFITLLVAILGWKRPEIKKMIPIYFCLLISILLWSVTTGYGRYAILLEIFVFIMLPVFAYSLCHGYSYKAVYIIFITCLIAFWSLYICTYNLTSLPSTWSEKPAIFRNGKSYLKLVKPNIDLILNDRVATKNPDIKEKISSVKTWVCIGPNSGYPVLANTQANFFLIYGNKPENPAEFAKQYFESHPQDYIYTLSYYFNENYYNQLLEYGFIIIDYERLSLNFVDANSPAWFLKLAIKEQAEIEGIEGLEFYTICNNIPIVSVLPVEINRDFLFKKDSQDNDYIVEGFSWPESGHIWMDQERAKIRIPINPNGNNLKIIIDGETLVQDQFVEVIVNNQIVGNMGNNRKEFLLDADYLSQKDHLTIQFIVSKLYSPKELGINDDTRSLGLSLKKIGIYKSE